ncbi:unnamed protein product [Citrullus colocynthis]|uniref:Uncharacterized protein n=1 Tax=Citrullus colocynthis TaxID=252529 RepID=A0ABP0XWC4_9ROSI
MKIGLYSVKSFVTRLIVATLLGLFSGSLKINPNFSLTNLYLCLKLNLTASSIWDNKSLINPQVKLGDVATLEHLVFENDFLKGS